MSDSPWIHDICDDCWVWRNGDRVPHRLIKMDEATIVCCYCKKPTSSGIVVRDDPKFTPCGGQHESKG